jgi:hypothetical protein
MGVRKRQCVSLKRATMDPRPEVERRLTEYLTGYTDRLRGG